MLSQKQDDLDIHRGSLARYYNCDLLSKIGLQQKQLVRLCGLEGTTRISVVQHSSESMSQVIALQSLSRQLNVCYFISDLGARVSWVL